MEAYFGKKELEHQKGRRSIRITKHKAPCSPRWLVVLLNKLIHYTYTHKCTYTHINRINVNFNFKQIFLCPFCWAYIRKVPLRVVLKQKCDYKDTFQNCPNGKNSFQGHTKKHTNAYARPSPEKHRSPHSLTGRPYFLSSIYLCDRGLSAPVFENIVEVI